MTNEINEVERWLDQVVIGLNLCPFAAQPRRKDQVRFVSSKAISSEALLTDLHDEIILLDQTPTIEIETILLIIPNMLTDFYEYNQFLNQVDQLIVQLGFEGIFQVASFHPDYCFADALPDAVENLTNRSPYPIFHIIREASIEKALESIESADEVFNRNIQTMQDLSAEQIKTLFSYL